MRKVRGFTMLEMVVVVLITVILLVTTGGFVVGPIESYVVAAETANLVNTVDGAFNRMARDIRASVPNTVRVKPSSARAIEMLKIVEGARYRKHVVTATGAGDILDFSIADPSFDLIGNYNSSYTNSTGVRVVVYNLGTYTSDINGDSVINSDDPDAGLNVYNSDNVPGGVSPPLTPGSHVMTPTGTTITTNNSGTGGSGLTTINPSHQFALSSPEHRLYLTDSAVSYVYSAADEALYRYEYSIDLLTKTQPTSPPGSPQLIIDNVTDCTFKYEPGSTTRTAMVTIRLTVTDAGGADVTLVRQIHVENSS